MRNARETRTLSMLLCKNFTRWFLVGMLTVLERSTYYEWLTALWRSTYYERVTVLERSTYYERVTVLEGSTYYEWLTVLWQFTIINLLDF